MDRWQPELCDPEYGYKWSRLRSRLAGEPDRPVLVAIGSSRLNLGLRPEVLRKRGNTADQGPVVFNFALNGAGPLLELLCLNRLLVDGVRPDYLIIEIHPALLHREEGWTEDELLNSERLRTVDLPVLRRLSSHPWLQLGNWCLTRLTPCYTHRIGIVTRYAHNLLPLEDRPHDWRRMDCSGWKPYPREAVNPVRYRQGVEHARREYAGPLCHFHISTGPDRALREMLAISRRRNIRALLLLMPEGSEFRSWYPPGSRSLIVRYLAALSLEYGVAIIDARKWMADRYFFDSHHLLPRGATQFTQRLGEQVLGPFLRNEQVCASARETQIERVAANGGALHPHSGDRGNDLE
jgi:hypothetical protein